MTNLICSAYFEERQGGKREEKHGRKLKLGRKRKEEGRVKLKKAQDTRQQQEEKIKNPIENLYIFSSD